MKATSKETFLSALRHLLTLVGGIAATHGWISKSEAIELVGALVALVGFIWGPLDEYLAARRIEEEARIAEAVRVAVAEALARNLKALPSVAQQTVGQTPGGQQAETV